MTENRTVWKSDNQGDKEETFIQTCRRGRDRQRRAERTRGKAVLADPVRRWIVERGGQGVAGRSREIVAGGSGGPTFTPR